MLKKDWMQRRKESMGQITISLPAETEKALRKKAKEARLKFATYLKQQIYKSCGIDELPKL